MPYGDKDLSSDGDYCFHAAFLPDGRLGITEVRIEAVLSPGGGPCDLNEYLSEVSVAMGHLTALVASVAYVVPPSESTPADKACRRGEHLHVDPCFRNYGCGRAFLDSGDGLKTYVLFREMFGAECRQCLLALFDLRFNHVYDIFSLPEDENVGVGEVSGQGGLYRLPAMPVDGSSMYQRQ